MLDRCSDRCFDYSWILSLSFGCYTIILYNIFSKYSKKLNLRAHTCRVTSAGLHLQDNARRATSTEREDAGCTCIASVCLSGAVFAWLQYTRSAVPVTHCKKKSAPKGAPYFIAYFYNVAIVAGPGFFPVLICGRARLFPVLIYGLARLFPRLNLCPCQALFLASISAAY